MKKVLIFGCSGFVGRYLSEEFYNCGYEVIGTDMIEPNKITLKFCADYHILSIMNSESVENLIGEKEPDLIVNLAAISSVGNSWNIPQMTMGVNVNGTLNILEAVRKSNIDAKLLLVGSSEEYSMSSSPISEAYPIEANNPYGISKVTQEHFADLYRDKYGLKIINTRTFNHTGVGQPDNFAIPSFVKQVAIIHNSGENGVMKVGNLSAVRDFGHVKDMASAYRMILESDTEGTVFNVGNGSSYRLSDILDFIVSLTHQEIKVEVDSSKLRPLDNPIIQCDNTYIKKEIGWYPRYTVFDAVRQMFDYYVADLQRNN